MIVFFIVCFAVFVLGTLIGLARGTGKSVFRLITIALAIAATFFLAIPFAQFLADKDMSGLVSEIDGVEVTTASETFVNILKSNETVAEVMADSPTLEAAARQIPVILFAVVTFIVCFIAFYLVSLIIYAIFKGLFRHGGSEKRKPSAGSRAGGAILGLLSAVICIGMILAPILGVANLMKELPEDTDIEAKEDYYDPVMNHAMIKLYNNFGFGALGDLYIKKASEITADDGSTVYVSEDVDTIAKIYALLDEYGVIEEVENGDFETSDMVKYLLDGNFSEKLFNLIFSSKTLTEAMKSLSLNGGAIIAGTLDLPETDAEGYDAMINAISNSIDGSSEEIELAGAYGAYLSGNANTVSNNESPVADATVDYAPSAVTKFTVPGSDKVFVLRIEDGETYIGTVGQNGKDGKMITVKEAVDKVDSLKKNIVEKFAKSVDTDKMNAMQKEEFESSLQTSVDKLIDEAAAAILNSTVYDAGKVTEFLNGSDNETDALRKENFNYGGVTVDSFAKAFADGITALIESDDEKAAETIVSVIVPAVQIISVVSSSGEGEGENAYVAPAVGQLVGAIHGSEALNGLGLTMLNAMSESSVVTAVVPVSVTNELIKVYTDSEGDITQTAVAMASSANIVAALSSGDADTVEKLIHDLTDNLNDSAAAQIQSLVTDEFMANFIDDAEFAANAKTISSAVIDVLSAAKGRASYSDEANALIYAYNLVVHSGSFSKDDLGSLLSYAVKSDIIASVLHKCNGCRVQLSEQRKQEYRVYLSACILSEATSKEALEAAIPVYNDVAAILELDLVWYVENFNL